MVFHLGELKKGIESGQLNENHIENADETHFVFNMDNGRTVGLDLRSMLDTQMLHLEMRESR